MIGLWDNDAILKLCAFGMTEEAKAVLALESVVVLSTARYRLCPTDEKRRKAAEKRWGAELVGRVEAFLQTCATIEMSPDDVADLTALDDLDAGEAILFKDGSLRQEDIVVTGDKRCIRALSTAAKQGHEVASQIVQGLTGRVFSLEQVFKLLVQEHGSANVLARMPIGGVDKVLDNVLRPDDGQTLEGLDSYIEHLRADVGGLLAQ